MVARHEKRIGMTILVAACLVLLIPVTYAWLANLEAAVEVFSQDWQLVPRWPAKAYYFAQYAARDLSTITWLAPLLVLVFPVIHGGHWLWRRRSGATPPVLGRVTCYPDRFPYFLIMLGLTGTLYGMLIGLARSGVEEVALIDRTARQTQATLDRLLAGTSTALLSSLAALGAAFLSHYVNRIYRWLTDPSDVRPSVPDPELVLNVCVASLGKLASAAESLTQRVAALSSELEPGRVKALFESIANQQCALKHTNTQLGGIADLLREGNQLRREQTASQEQRDEGIRKQIVEIHSALEPLDAIQTAVEETTMLNQDAESHRMSVLKAIAKSFNGVDQQKTHKRARVRT